MPKGVRIRTQEDLTAAFLEKVPVRPSNECWLWTGAINANGYGNFKLRGKTRGAHRVGYELFVGPIPDGLTLDHLCRTPACVNPRHLEPVTQRENTLRGETLAASQAKRTHCPQGHLYDEENTYWHRRKRSCRRCRLQRGRVSSGDRP